MDKERRSALGNTSQVQRVMQRGIARQDEAQGRDGRGQPGRSGEKGTDSTGRAKATYGITLAAQEIARTIGEAEGISQADVVEVALRAFEQLYQAGKIDLYPFKTPARSLKATWKLKQLEELKIF